MVESMTDSPTTTTENVGRGVTFALLSIPASIVMFALLAGFTSIISGLIAIVVPTIAAGLYARGAGAPLSRKGWGPFVAVAGVAVVLGTFAGIVGATWANYKGHDGFFSSTFFRSVGSQFTVNLENSALPILIGLGLGAVGIAAVLRNPRSKTGLSAQKEAEAAAPATPVAPATPAAPAVPVPPAANQPSPGVILNGKPVDPSQK